MELTAFIGREVELKALRAFCDNPSRSRVTAIYGRRRIGKTRLVMEAYRDFQVLHFEGLDGASSAQQKKHFLKTLYRHSNMEAHRLASTSDWEDLLILLAEHIAGEPCVVFFDEFQWMAAGRNELVSKLKFVWDNYLVRNARVHLILCGSISSFLVKNVIRSRALYGRIDEIMHLGPLGFSEARAGFFASRSTREALEYYLVMGGVPKYLELYDKRRSVRLNLIDLCFRPGAYFHDEFDRLFVSHFGKVRHYRNIVEFLALRGFATRDEIAKRIGLKSGGRISGFLENLCLAGFIEGYGPVQNPESAHLRRYRIADSFLRFYFRFIRSQKSQIGRSPEGLPLHQALPEKRYHVFLGLAFEHFCYQHAHLIAKRLGFSAIAYDYGSWFRKSDLSTGAQVDLLFKRADKVLTLCEVKFRERVGKEIIEEVDKKAEALSAFGNFTIERVLISAFPPSDELNDEGYFSAILTVEDL
jgi:AAA+ ATPase superfamily predicted ATPase